MVVGWVEDGVRKRKLLKYPFRKRRPANPTFPIYPGSRDYPNQHLRSIPIMEPVRMKGMSGGPKV